MAAIGSVPIYSTDLILCFAAIFVLEGIHFFRRALVQQKIEEATETMIARLSKTKTNDEFLKLIAR